MKRHVPSMIALLVLSAGQLTYGQCGGTWAPGNDAPGQLRGNLPLAGPVRGTAVVSFDDGTGLTLYTGNDEGRVYKLVNGRWVQLGGNFLANASGSTVTGYGKIARLIVFDDGSGAGEKLYAIGRFRRVAGNGAISVRAGSIARWNGTNWEAVGPGSTTTRGVQGRSEWLEAAIVHDEDGSGPSPAGLFVAGSFATAGGTVSSPTVAKLSWDANLGAQVWSVVGVGATPSTSSVRSLAVYDNDGNAATPSVLVAGGSFNAMGAASGFVAQWNGLAWQSMSDVLNLDDGAAPASSFGDEYGANTGIGALTTYRPLPSGPQRIMASFVGSTCGVFELIGNSWVGVAPFADACITRLATDTTSAAGDTVYAQAYDGTQGFFPPLSTPHRRLANGSWQSLGELRRQICPSSPLRQGTVLGLDLVDVDGAGPQGTSAYFSGSFESAPGTLVHSFASYNPALGTWASPTQTGNGGTYGVLSFATLDADGGGPAPSELYAYSAGALGNALSPSGTYRWTSTGWSAVGNCGTIPSEQPDQGAFRLIPADIDGVRRLTLGGLALIDNAWVVGPTTNGGRPVGAFDLDGSGPQGRSLIALRGYPFEVSTDEGFSKFVRRESTQWVDVPGNFSFVQNDAPSTPAVMALAELDVGQGPQLFAYGSFNSIDGVPAQRIAVWNGAGWTGVGQPALNAWPSVPSAVTIGGSRAMYVGEIDFDSQWRIRRWDGTAWTTLPGSTSSRILSTFGFDDGRGEALYITWSTSVTTPTAFDTPTGAITTGIARWDGTQWSAVGAGVVTALVPIGTLPEPTVVFNDGTGPAAWLPGVNSLAPASLGYARLLGQPCGPTCNSIDFNRDGLFPDDADLLDFLTVLAGGTCSTGNCDDIDFNNDSLFPDDSDLIALLVVLAGGNCQ